MDEIDLEIQDMIKIFKNRWKVIVVIMTIITLITGGISFWVIKPVYKVNTKVFIGKDESKDEKYSNNDIEMYQKLLTTYAELIKTNDLIKNTINGKNLDVTTTEVSDNLVVTPRTDTQILQISFENNNNLLAKEVLVALVDEFIKEAKLLIPNGTIRVIESAELPQYPVSPNNVKNIGFGFLGGLVVGVIISLLMEYMDDTLKTKEQIEQIMGISVIGVIPCEGKRHKIHKDKYVKAKNNELSNPVC